MSFFAEYLKNPVRIGAVAPSSKWLAKQMIEGAGFENARCIVEYGPGTGVFTREIIKNKNPKTQFFAIEQNEGFYQRLAERFAGDPSVHIIHSSAANVKEILAENGFCKTELILSGLPFASLPHEVSGKILAGTEEVLTEGGRFITFQYTLFKRKLFEERFRIVKKRFEFRNLPPAFVFVMEHKRAEMPNTIRRPGNLQGNMVM